MVISNQLLLKEMHGIRYFYRVKKGSRKVQS